MLAGFRTVPPNSWNQEAWLQLLIEATAITNRLPRKYELCCCLGEVPPEVGRIAKSVSSIVSWCWVDSISRCQACLY